MENLCMRYLAVSFLRWVVTSCVMWATTACPSTPSFAASNPRVAHRGVVDRPVHRAPLDRRALAARLARRVQVAPRDRAAAAGHLDPATLLDPTEALVPPGKAAAQGPADTPDRAVALAAVDRRDRVDRLVAPDRVALLAHREAAVPQVARVPQARRVARARQGRLDPVVDRPVVPAALVPQDQAAPRARLVPPAADHREAGRLEADLQVVAHRVARDLADQAVADQAAADLRVDRKAAHRVDLAANPVRVRNQVPSRALGPDRKVAANHRVPVPDHQDKVVADLDQAALVPAVQVLAASHPVEVPAADQDPVDLVRVPVPEVDLDPAALAPVVSVARDNRMERAVVVVVFQEAADRAPRADAAVPATTNGMGLAGFQYRFPIRVLSRTDRSRQSAFAQETSQLVRVPTSVKSFTRDANKV